MSQTMQNEKIAILTGKIPSPDFLASEETYNNISTFADMMNNGVPISRHANNASKAINYLQPFSFLKVTPYIGSILNIVSKLYVIYKNAGKEDSSALSRTITIGSAALIVGLCIAGLITASPFVLIAATGLDLFNQSYKLYKAAKTRTTNDTNRFENAMNVRSQKNFYFLFPETSFNKKTNKYEHVNVFSEQKNKDVYERLIKKYLACESVSEKEIAFIVRYEAIDKERQDFVNSQREQNGKIVSKVRKVVMGASALTAAILIAFPPTAVIGAFLLIATAAIGIMHELSVFNKMGNWLFNNPFTPKEYVSPRKSFTTHTHQKVLQKLNQNRAQTAPKFIRNSAEVQPKGTESQSPNFRSTYDSKLGIAQNKVGNTSQFFAHTPAQPSNHPSTTRSARTPSIGQ